MSIESVHAMIETAEKDGALYEQLQTAEGPEAILAIASNKGYEFTEEELLSVMQEKQLSFGEELSEEQLESVAGGLTITLRGPGNKTRYEGNKTRYEGNKTRKSVSVGNIGGNFNGDIDT